MRNSASDVLPSTPRMRFCDCSCLNEALSEKSAPENMLQEEYVLGAAHIASAYFFCS